MYLLGSYQMYQTALKEQINTLSKRKEEAGSV